jgi:hypothetical protein
MLYNNIFNNTTILSRLIKDASAVVLSLNNLMITLYLKIKTKEHVYIPAVNYQCFEGDKADAEDIDEKNIEEDDTSGEDFEETEEGVKKNELADQRSSTNNNNQLLSQSTESKQIS